jgi:hypothetical protein
MTCTHRINPARGIPRFLSRFARVPDLFICAKHLFFAAMVTIAPCQSEPSRQFE